MNGEEMHTRRRTLEIAMILGCLTAMCSAPAWAYSGTEHIRFPDQAYQVMNIMRRGGFYADQARRINPTGTYAPLTTRPPGVPASQDAAWNTFVTQALAAPALLDSVAIALPPPPRTSQDCGGVYASLPPDAQFAACHAGDLGFAPKRSWAQNTNECYLRPGYKFGAAGNDSHPVTPFFQDLQSNFTGSLLGFWATKPDDETNDTSVFIRPTNLLVYGELRNLAEDAVEIAAASVLVPLFCIGDFIFSGNPTGCIDDAKAAAHDVDPVARIDDSILLPIEEMASGLTGPAAQFLLFGKSNPASFWHFGVPSHSGAFNTLAGFDLSAASLNNFTDAVDAGLIAYFDLTGITVDPFKSDGIPRYGQFENGPLSRHNSDWASFSVAHVEFDPVSNMARYGWQQFLQTGTARGLGWVLHAIGDAFCPQHVLGSLGWGHQPWERYADVRWVDQRVFPEDKAEVQLNNMVTELTYAFQYWTFANQSPPADWVGPLIGKLVADTAALPESVQGRVFKTNISLTWALGSNSDSDATGAYDGEIASLADLMMRSVGASIAFLAKASVSVPTGTASACGCTGASARSAEDGNGALIPSPAGVCLACGTGVFAAEPVLLDGRCVASCPRDKPTVSGGICTATNACPVNTPFVLNGSCVASCCPFDSTCPTTSPIRQNGVCVPLSQCSVPFVVDDRTCATACPSGQTPDPATNYCKRPRATTSSSCSADSALCAQDSDCCSGSCRLADGICRRPQGSACVVDDDCKSEACHSGVCAGLPGDACHTDTDCTTRCTSGTNNKCCALESSACVVNSDCCGGADPSNGIACSSQGRCILVCKGETGLCSSNLDCCSNNCVQQTTMNGQIFFACGPTIPG
jgi:hypothetical protein